MSNLKHLLASTPKQMIYLTQWFKDNDISTKSIFDHKKYGWIDSIGHGAYIKTNITPEISAGISAICTQTNYKMHIGGIYVLEEFHGIQQYIREKRKPQIFTTEKNSLPTWFEVTFKDSYDLFKTTFLPDDVGIAEQDFNDMKIQSSKLERALLEMLYTGEVSTVEAFQLLELMTVLNVNLMNELLSKCKSIKIKRLFLYLASQTGYSWYDKIDKSTIDLGSGVREIDKSGLFNKEFNIVVNKVSEA